MSSTRKAQVRKEKLPIMFEPVRPGRRGEAPRRGGASETYKLEQLLKAITPNNQHSPKDFGKPQGKEAW